jgi:hypothetical protein
MLHKTLGQLAVKYCRLKIHEHRVRERERETGEEYTKLHQKYVAGQARYDWIE